MEIAKIRGETRQPGGRHANERLRRRGLVPAVIYGHNEPPETVALSRHDLLLALEHLRHVVQLDINGKRQQYLIKDVQYDHLQADPLHVDLMRVDPNERVHVKVPLEFKGEPRGVHEGGEFMVLLADLEIECPLLEIPEALPQHVAELGLEQALHVRDLELPPGVKAINEPDEVVALVRAKRGVEVEEEEAEAAEGAEAEPEVIGKGSKEDDEGADGA